MNDFHKLFPNSGQGKHYEFHLEQLTKVQQLYTRPIRILDWGAGKGGTTQWLREQGFAVWAYDPYWEPNSATETLQAEYDAIVTGDVLEHIHTEDIPWDYFRTIKHNIHCIDLTPAKKSLPDGRNAHINLQSRAEWMSTFYTHLGGEVVEHTQSRTADPHYTWRTRLCLHIKL